MGENRRNRRKIGAHYEEKAVAFLEKKGYQILQKNFYSRYGEIEIVAKDGQTLVFVEVKFRQGQYMGTALEAVTSMKRRRIQKAAEYYIYCHPGYFDAPARFDVIAYEGEKLFHIESAFETDN